MDLIYFPVLRAGWQKPSQPARLPNILAQPCPSPPTTRTGMVGENAPQRLPYRIQPHNLTAFPNPPGFPTLPVGRFCPNRPPNISAFPKPPILRHFNRFRAPEFRVQVAAQPDRGQRWAQAYGLRGGETTTRKPRLLLQWSGPRLRRVAQRASSGPNELPRSPRVNSSGASSLSRPSSGV